MNSKSYTILLKTALVVFSCLFMGKLYAQCPGNLLTNSGFESGLTDWNVNSGSVTLITDSYTGTNAARLDGENTSFTQTITGTPGNEYTFKVWAKATTDLDFGNVGLGFYDGSWSLLDDEKVEVTSNTWTEYSVSYTAPTGTVYILADSYADADDGSMTVDDFCLTVSTNTLIVTTASDIADAPDTTSIGALLSNKGADGHISLREAISASNNTAGLDTIKFAIGSGLQTITVTDSLPIIYDPIYLDATTQPGYTSFPIIQLDGSVTSGTMNGLYLRSSNSTIKGFIVHSFADEGIEIDGSTGYGNNNVIENNWVGITSTGAAAGNGDEGILISVDADGNTVRNNISSSNGGDGLEIHTNSDNNWVWGNIIGLGTDGSTIRGNSGQGMRIGGNGNFIGTDNNGTNDANERNIISGNYHGIYVTSNSTSDTIAGNYIGLDITGTQAKGNTANGIFVQDATNLTINNNTISANNYGINLENSILTNIYGNYIGTDATGISDIGNSLDGIVIQDGSNNNTVGGNTIDKRNILSGNDNDGVWITGASTYNNTVQGNWIGINSNGDALGNTFYGIGVENGTYDNLIGGTTNGQGNVISSNAWSGIGVAYGGVNNNTIQGNIIGLNTTGTATRGNSQYGIYIHTGATNTTIGGTEVGARNIISGNSSVGILIVQSSNNQIQGNYIGTDINGTIGLKNDAGITIGSSSSNNTIGGTTEEAANIIAFNDEEGVTFAFNAGTGNAILGNSFHSNGNLAIDLGDNNSPNPNDLDDTDTGGNNLQNFPELSSALTNEVDEIIIYGSLNSTPSTSFRIEFFSNSNADPSGYGEGETFLGDTTVTTDFGGDVSFSKTLTGIAVPENYSISTTATDLSNNTSEFSSSVTVELQSGPSPESPGMAIYGSATNVSRYRIWDGTAFEDQEDAVDHGAALHYNQSALASTRDEAIWVGQTNDYNIRGQIWTNNQWNVLPFSPMVNLGGGLDFWQVDVAYEQISGDAIIVWDNATNGTTGLSYRVWNGSTWTNESTITVPIGDDPENIRLASKLGSDEIVLMVSTGYNDKKYAMVWNGSSWGNSVILDGGTGSEYPPNASVTYLQDSGDAMVVYGRNSDTNISISTWNGSVWTIEPTLTPPSGITGVPWFTVLSPLANSDKVALGVLTDNYEVWYAIYDGTNWDDKVIATTTSPDRARQHMSIAFEQSSGHALATYAANATTTNVQYRTWNGSNWSSEQTGPQIDLNPRVLVLFPNKTNVTDEIMLGSTNSGAHPFYTVWNGNGWDTPLKVTGTTGINSRQPFEFMWCDLDNTPIVASIGNNVWNDIDGDGIQDGGELGIQNVLVYLYDSGDTQIDNTSTDVSGNYMFTDVTPGDYYIKYILPVGYTFSPKDQGGDNALDSDADQVSGETATTSIIAGENDLTWDAGMYEYATIGDFVWDDTDQDGIQDAGELGLPNVTVNLHYGGGSLVGTTTTNGAGFYSFTNIIPGGVYVDFILPGGYSFSPQNVGSDLTDSDANTSSGQTTTTTLAAGENDPTWDAGMYFNETCVGNLLSNPSFELDFTDWTTNGDVTIINDAHLGIKAATVTGGADANIVQIVPAVPGNTYTLTVWARKTMVDYADVGFYFLDSGGTQLVDNLAEVTNVGGPYVMYTVEATAPVGTVSLKAYAWPGENVDNELSVDEYCLNEEIATTASIGDYVWHDVNEDGIQNVGESGIENVTVNIYKVDGTPSGTTTTNSSGIYTFTDLIPGEYFIDFILPPNYGFSPKNEGGDDTKDSDVNSVGETAVTQLIAGINDLTWDAGMFVIAPGSISSYVWHDLNYNGVQDAGELGIKDVDVNLYNSSGDPIQSEKTNASGFYTFTDVLPGDYFIEFVPENDYIITFMDQGGDDNVDSDVDPITNNTNIFSLSSGQNISFDGGMLKYSSIGDFVWYDSNENGIQDSKEKGVSNVPIILFTSDGTPVAYTLTDKDGEYIFEELLPGSYGLMFIPPDDYLISPQDQGGNDATDSDINPTNGRTSNFVIISDVNIDTWDAGLYYSPTGIDISLTSDAACADPGTVITYTLEATNTGGINHSFIEVENEVPEGTSYVAESTSVTATFGNKYENPSEVKDEFNDISYANNDGFDSWIGNWSEIGEQTDPNYGRVKVKANTGVETYAARWGGTYFSTVDIMGYGIERSVDLEGAISANLIFDFFRFVDGTAPSFSLNVQVKQSGGSWVTIDNLNFADLDGRYDLDISSFTSPVTSVRFIALGNMQVESEDYLFIDNVEVSYAKLAGVQVTETRTNGTGGTLDNGSLPSLVTLIDEANIPVGETMTINFQVVVDDPLDSGVDEIYNETYIETDLLEDVYTISEIVPLCGPPPATLGNFIWNDTDGDDVQDAGELGFDNVTVDLYLDDGDGIIDGGDTHIGQQTTSGGGYYTFTGLVPGDYLVTVTDDNSILDGYVLSAGSDPQEVTLIAVQIFNDADFGYYIDLTEYDYGDLPAPYPTLVIDDGARHRYDGVTFLGNPGSTNSDIEPNGQPNASATGDDINGTDDDDGVTFLTPFMPGESARISISAGVAGYLNTWIDFNNDGDFDDGGEQIADEYYLNAGNNQIEIEEVSYDAVGTINSRFRFTAGLGEANTPFGTAPNGEVEDYKLNSIQCFVWEDLYNGKQNEGEEGLNDAVVFLFNDIMSPIAGVQTKNHPITGEPGWCEFPGVPQGNYYLQFNLLGGYSFTIKDAGDDDSIDSDADEITGFSDVINITSNGEVFRVDAGMKENTQIDFGDLPEVYQTFTANDGPGHIVDSQIYLGSSVPDSETNGQPNSTATGDDIDGNNDDDGITFLHPLHPGRQVDISIEASKNDKFLNAWIDFNNNSTFSDPGEHIAIDIELDAGNNIYSLPAIPSTATGPMHSRFRFSSDTGLLWYGPASDGEVEDYALGVIGNFIWVDINGDGVQNDGDYSGLNDVQVNLLDGSGNPVLCKLGNPIFTVTKNSLHNGYPGYYEFPGLPPGDYMIEVITLPGYDFTTKDNSGDDQTDSDVDAVTGRSDIISISLGLNNDFSDAGFTIDNPTSIGDYVWNDFDGDGIQDGSEVGIGQITIELYRDINHDNILDVGDVLIRQQTTETDGSYEFMGLLADDYLVMVTDDNGILGYYSISGGINPHNIELSAGQDYNDADFGYKTFDFDFGDLPSPYPTTVSNNGPRHVSLETGDVKMGLRMDTEIDGQEHDNAYADDSDKGPTLDDEDGVSFITPLHPGRSAKVNISMPVLNSSGYINAWIDFNTDGDFDDTDEKIATDIFVEYGNANSLIFSVPEDASGVEYSRFRLTLNSDEATSYTGTAPNGEVEDYALGTISGYAFDDISGDGLQDITDPIIQGVLVKLLDTVGNPILDADNNPITILTDENGFYEFPGLFPNYYTLEFVKQGATVFTIPNRVHESLHNSKVNVLSGRTSTINVENGSVFNEIYVGIFNDADNDHVPDILEGNSDNDADGLINSNDYDPAGYIYDGTSGEILSGGLIEVSGPGVITIIEDGSSGYYEFYTDGTEGVYTISLTPPSGYEISSTCGSLDPPAFDPTGLPNPIYLGSSESGSTGYLSDFDCVDNPYYFTFDLAPGDPFIINNNFPLEQVTTGTIGDYVLNDINHDGLQDAGDVGIENVKLTLLDGTSTEIAFTWTNSEGWYEFSGLVADNYTITIDENTLGEFVYLSYEYDGIEVPGAEVSLGEGEINLDLDFGYKDTPLPITLASFGIEKSLEGIKVIWTTESEIENQGFVIERRNIDANEEWNEIASFLTETELKGQGTVTSSTNYEYIDQLIIPGNTYEYRLGDVDYNGLVTYHTTEIIKIDITDKFGVPSSFTVNPAYPNPFNPSTVIEYALPKTGKIKVAIFDILGHRVKSLVNTEQSAGWHSITWNGVDDNGSSVPAGMYFGVIITEFNKKTVKLMFLK